MRLMNHLNPVVRLVLNPLVQKQEAHFDLSEQGFLDLIASGTQEQVVVLASGFVVDSGILVTVQLRSYLVYQMMEPVA